MKIALDWDETITRNPEFWKKFVRLCRHNNVDVRIVTMRYRREVDSDNEMGDFVFNTGIPVICTDREQKRAALHGNAWYPDIWIDDSPEYIVDWKSNK